MAEILLSQGGQTLLRFPLRQTTLKVGRSAECDIILTDEAISRVQLIIYQSEGIYFAKNMGQLPLIVKGKPVESSPFQEGTSLEVGPWQLTYSASLENNLLEETYVSQAAGQNTLVVNASYLSHAKTYTADQLEILVKEPQKTERRYRITQPVTTLGKGRSCDLVLEDSYASEVHAKIVVKENHLSLLDLGSTNGTLVNGVKVREAQLEEGSTLIIGKTQLCLHYLSETKTLEPTKENFLGSIVGSSPSMRELYRVLLQVAPTEATVCILGETGTGKELVARSIHDLSPRHLKPWVAINCGAISRELIQSELFGHEKGAFTGAQQQRIGVFEQAKGGTLFLDEIGELPLDLQATLLRVLETGKLRRVGGNQDISVDVRVVCATHRDLSLKVKEGAFREDLFFRLYVFPVLIPPLRERKEDIILLAQHFLKTMLPAGKKLRFNEEANRYLESQVWRGNVRELKNIVQRAIVLATGPEIGKKELESPASLFPEPEEALSSFPLNSIPTQSNLQNLEKEMILRELRVHEGNRQAAARALGIAKSTLYEKLKSYGIK